jgi:tetratricopeptide (TPR) repeat protein
VLALPARSSAKESWTRVRSQNFTVVGNVSESDLRKLAVKLEQFRYVLSLLLFKDQQSFDPFKPRYRGKTVKQIAGYFQSGDDVNYIALTKELGATDPFQVIFHEFKHFVVHNNISNAPPWLDEGLAEFYSTFEPLSELKVRIGIPLAWHVRTLRDRDILPLKTLLTVDRKSPYYNERDKVGIFYAQSWALVHFLMLGEGGKHQGQLTRFIQQMNSGVSPEENFRQSFGADYKTIEDALRSYVRKFEAPALDVTFREMSFVKEMRADVLSEAEANYYLGDLHLRGGELKEAEELLQKSTAQDARFAPSRVSLSALRLRQGRAEEAAKLAQEAIDIDPKNYMGHLYLANILAQQKQYEEAIKSYNRAALLKPDAWRIHAGLARAYLGTGQDSEASKAFSAALRLNPRNAGLNRAYSYAALGLRKGSLAAINARVYLQRQGWRDDQSLYMVVVAHYGYRMAERSKDAAEVLEEAATRSDTSGWPYPVVEYLQGKLTTEALLALATDTDKKTEAHAYLGLDMSLKGEREAALKHLRWVRENGNRDFIEYPLAVAELNRLEEAARTREAAEKSGAP